MQKAKIAKQIWPLRQLASGMLMALCFGAPLLWGKQLQAKVTQSLPADVANVIAATSQENSPATTAQEPSQLGLTVPSLWWVDEQFGGKLVANWLVYPLQNAASNRVDVVVRREIWSLLGYFERYAFVNHFGTAASDYGYNLLIVDRQKNILAAYTCNFAQVQPDYIEGTRDAQQRLIPNYLPAKKDDLSCQLWQDPLVRFPAVLP